MIKTVTKELLIPLLDKTFYIDCYIEINKGEVLSAEIDKKQLKNFEEEFFHKYLLEYGDFKMNFIKNEYSKYIQKIYDFLEKEEQKEKKRIAELLKDLTDTTINFLKEVDKLNPKRGKGF